MAVRRDGVALSGGSQAVDWLQDAGRSRMEGGGGAGKDRTLLWSSGGLPSCSTEQCACVQGAMKQGITEHVRVKKVHEKTGVGAVPPPPPPAYQT